jgi:GNAT superfamily N-acetyltransferase
MFSQRRATVEDIPLIARLHRLAFFDAMPHMPGLHTPEEDLAFYTTVVFPRTDIHLIEIGKVIAGFLAFRPGWIEQFYIHPDHQRRGLGTQLLHTVQTANASLQLWTFQCNQCARRFYEKHGFRVTCMTDGAGNEARQPDILYSWERDALTAAGNHSTP